MIEVNQHIIQKQVLALELPSEQGAFELQQKWSRHFQEKLLPQLADLFDRIVPNNQIIRLDKLEIDLGVLSLEDFENRLLTTFEEELSQLNRSDITKIVIQQGKVDKVTTETAQIQAFCHFLEFGVLPWSMMTENTPDLRQEIAKILQNRPSYSKEIAELKTVFLEKVSTLPVVIFDRLIAQFSDAFIASLLAIIYEIPIAKIKAWLTSKVAGLQTVKTITTLQKRKTQWQKVFEEISSLPSVSTLQKKSHFFLFDYAIN